MGSISQITTERFFNSMVLFFISLIFFFTAEVCSLESSQVDRKTYLVNVGKEVEGNSGVKRISAPEGANDYKYEFKDNMWVESNERERLRQKKRKKDKKKMKTQDKGKMSKTLLDDIKKKFKKRDEEIRLLREEILELEKRMEYKFSIILKENPEIKKELNGLKEENKETRSKLTAITKGLEGLQSILKEKNALKNSSNCF